MRTSPRGADDVDSSGLVQCLSKLVPDLQLRFILLANVTLNSRRAKFGIELCKSNYVVIRPG